VAGSKKPILDFSIVKELTMAAGAYRAGRRSGWMTCPPRAVGRALLAACLLVGWNAAVVTVAPTVAVAQDALDDEMADESQPQSVNMLAYYAGALGWIFGPVFLILSFVLVALLVMCFLQLRKSVLLPAPLSEQFEQHLEAKEYQPAYELARGDDSYLGHVLAAGMGKLQSGYPAAVEAMQEAQGEQQMRLEHKISYVSLIGALAPLFGLLGTVTGMVDSFSKIAANPGVAPKPDQLASGISQALVTTLIGLWIAIPAIACFALFKNRLEDIQSSATDESMRLMGRFQGVAKK
jgi:biopolymer transport protein ExbB